MSERLYTLDEARTALFRETCDRQGHDFQILVNGVGIPTDLVCLRCGDRWRIQDGAEAKERG